jgi:hypothetical protein
VIYDHREQRWSDVDREKLLIRPTELSGNDTSSYLVADRKSNDEFGIAKYLCSCIERLFNMLQNLTTCGVRVYFPSGGRRAADFYRP